MRDEIIRRSLTACLRGRFDPAALEEAERLMRCDGFDWEAWLQAAESESVAPLLHRILHGRESLPPHVAEHLRTAYQRSAVRNLLAFRDLAGLLAGFERDRIPAIVLKGAALAETVYGDIAVRPMADLDLLVARGDMGRAVLLMEGLGYRTIGLETHPGSAIEYENEVALARPGGAGTMVELHWSLLDSPHHQRRMAMDWFWASAERPHPPSPLLRGEGLRVLGPEALLLHLCAHLALHHRGEGLLWLHDIAEVLHFYCDRLNGDLLLAKAAEYDLVLPLQGTLPRVAEGWGAPLPDDFLRRLARLQPSPAEVRVFRRLTAAERPVAFRFWADLAAMDGWRARLRYGLGNLFPSPAYMRGRYGIRHGWLLPLYYPYRWWVGLRGGKGEG